MTRSINESADQARIQAYGHTHRVSEGANQLSRLLSDAQWTLDGQAIAETDALRIWQSWLQDVKQKQANSFVIGNGGSAAIASHVCVDLINALNMPAITLHDPSLLTCLTNDHGYDQAFALSLTKLARPDDLLIAISSSGHSANILNAVATHQSISPRVFGLSGFRADNPLRQFPGLHCWLPVSHYGLVEVGHMFVLHFLIDHAHDGSP